MPTCNGSCAFALTFVGTSLLELSEETISADDRISRFFFFLLGERAGGGEEASAGDVEFQFVNSLIQTQATVFDSIFQEGLF